MKVIRLQIKILCVGTLRLPGITRPYKSNQNLSQIYGNGNKNYRNSSLVPEIATKLVLTDAPLGFLGDNNIDINIRHPTGISIHT